MHILGSRFGLKVQEAQTGSILGTLRVHLRHHCHRGGWLGSSREMDWQHLLQHYMQELDLGRPHRRRLRLPFVRLDQAEARICSQVPSS